MPRLLFQRARPSQATRPETLNPKVHNPELNPKPTDTQSIWNALWLSPKLFFTTSAGMRQEVSCRVEKPQEARTGLWLRPAEGTGVTCAVIFSFTLTLRFDLPGPAVAGPRR